MAETIKGVVQTNRGPVKIAGEPGATFTPHVSEDLVLSWTNDKGLDNPPEVQLPVGGESAIYIGEDAPDDDITLVWIDTANDAVKYRDPETGGFVAVAIGNGTSASVEIDDTLTVPGAAADAAAVGAELKNKYSAENEPPYPVKSVCGKTGAVSLTAGDVGADPSGRATGLIAAHNTSGAAHNDIRSLISGLTTRLNALADSDDTTLDQLSEIVEYIKANKTLIDSITTSKVSVADIIDNLTTSVSNKPLSAKMGVELKKLIDAIEIPISLPASDVYDWAKQPTKPTYTKNEVGLGNVDNVRQYSASNPPPYPVTSVNGQTGAVSVTADGIGAASKETVKQLSETIADLEFDPTVYGLPVLYLTGDISPIAVSKDNKVTLDYTYGERSGTCTLKGQGASSYKTAQALVNEGKAGKFNYTINFDTAFEATEGWGAQQKYCLKANFIDSTHSRNVVSAKIWGKIVKSRTVANTTLNALPNGGAIDGFPIIIIVNGKFHGLYTFNIPKDGWMFGLVEDATKTQAMVGANQHSPATQFKGELAGDESDFELEFVSDENNTAWVSTSLNRLINACVNSWGGDLDDVVGQYLDWDSAIDYYILVVVLRGSDMVDKNFLLTTYDGEKWIFTAYDMDTTYGLQWDGSMLNRPVTNIKFTDCAEINRVFELIKRFKTNELKARYNVLRADILSESRLYQTFENFAWAIPSPVALEDIKVYPTIPGSSVNGIDQICRWIRQRLESCDMWIDALPAQETPVEPEEPSEGYTNLVPTSIDTDGSIYNGVGYKNGVRLSSSGGVSGTAQTGSVTTGFMPYSNLGIIRVKGATWQKEDGYHYYINAYDANQTFKSGINASSYSAGTYSGLSVVYDDVTGVTTIDFSGMPTNNATRAAFETATYIRLNAKGSGEDLIVTVGEEIV